MTSHDTPLETLPNFATFQTGESSRDRTPLEHLFALADNDTDRAKIARASFQQPEAAIINALEAAAGEDVTNPLAAALARLKRHRDERAAPTETSDFGDAA